MLIRFLFPEESPLQGAIEGTGHTYSYAGGNVFFRENMALLGHLDGTYLVANNPRVFENAEGESRVLVNVVPAPGAAMLVPMVGVMATRRRRASR